MSCENCILAYGPAAVHIGGMSTDLAQASKGALVRQVERLHKSRAREKAKALETGERVTDLLGVSLAGITGAVVGAAEGRFRNRDKSPLSVGPVPLPLATAAVASVGALFTGNRSFAYAAAGALGAMGYNLGKGWGASTLAKSGVSGVGEERLSDVEHELLFGEV